MFRWPELALAVCCDLLDAQDHPACGGCGADVTALGVDCADCVAEKRDGSYWDESDDGNAMDCGGRDPNGDWG